MINHELLDKLSGYNYFNEFINSDNSASSSEELDVIFDKCIDAVVSPNKTCNFHVLNGENDSEVTTVDSCKSETLQEAAAKFVEIMQMKIRLLNQNSIHNYFI